MWNPEDDKTKNLLSKESLASLHKGNHMPSLELMTDYQIFRYNFINSELVRRAHGFERKHGKLYLVDRAWVDTTVDLGKKEWVRELYKEFNGTGELNVGEKKDKV